MVKKVHIAIMRKSWGLTSKILTGEKTIESRWYQNRYQPWDQIREGEVIYFKDSGEPVTVRAEVVKVEQYSDLDKGKREQIINKYSYQDLGTTEISKEVLGYIKDKRYCLIIFLKNPQKVEPFNINKSGFGAMASWLVVDDINTIKQL